MRRDHQVDEPELPETDPTDLDLDDLDLMDNGLNSMDRTDFDLMKFNEFVFSAPNSSSKKAGTDVGHEARLNGELTTLLLPLTGKRTNSQHNVPSEDELGIYGAYGPFLPARIKDSQDAQFLGTATLVATQVYRDLAQVDALVRFGNSQGTVDDDSSEECWEGQPSVCITLFDTEHGRVLAVERVDRRGFLADLDFDPMHGKKAIARTLCALTAGTECDFSSDLAKVLGIDGAQLGLIFDAVTVGPNFTRGKAFIEGLIVHTLPRASSIVEKIAGLSDADVDGFDRAEAEQGDALAWKWNAFPLVDEPVESDAQIAVRQDGRSVVLNLEATSVHHDYEGIGGRFLIIGCIPFIAIASSLARYCADVAAEIDGINVLNESLTESDVATLEKARRGIDMGRKLWARWLYLHTFTVSEMYATWTHGGQLVAILDRVMEPRSERLANTQEKLYRLASELTDRQIREGQKQIQIENEKEREQNRIDNEKERERHQEEREQTRIDNEKERERRHNSAGRQAITIGIAFLSVVLGTLMTTAAAPSLFGAGLIGFWGALGWFGGALAVGSILGLLIRRWWHY